MKSYDIEGHWHEKTAAQLTSLGCDRRISRITFRSDTKLQQAIAAAGGLAELDTLGFDSSGVTQTQLAAILSTTSVKKFYLRGEPLPRTEISWLRHDGLEWLCVMRTQFSNRAIEDLPSTLVYFDATRTRINDEGLDGFVRLSNLKTLKLSRTPTTEKGIEQLRTAMPWCDLRWQPLTNP